MSTITNLIFNGVAHKVTSPFGPRDAIYKNGKLISAKKIHEGTDYAATGSKKSLDQFAIEDGYIFAAAKSNSDGALYVWIVYPRVKLAMLHYHLASYSVKTGQKVKKLDKLGVTGATGNVTGIHLHLGIRDLSKLSTAQINKMTWDLLRSCSYVDPEKVNYAPASTAVKAAEAPKATTPTTKTVENKTTPVKATGKPVSAKHQDKAKAKGVTLTVQANGGLHIRTDYIDSKSTAARKTETDLGVLPNGTKVRWYGYYNVDGDGVKWYYVAVNNKTGYCSSKYLK